MKKIINVLICICIICMILFLNVGTINIIINYKDYLEFSKILSLFGLVLLLLYLWYKVINKDKIKIKDILAILLSIFGIISYVYALDKNIALYGAYSRNEGLLVILSYYSIFLASSTVDKKWQKIIMYILLFTGMIQVFIGGFQFFRVDKVFGYDRSNNFSTRFKVASGTFGNPNFYSSYILMCLIYCYTKFLNNSKKMNKIIFLLLTIYFSYGLIIGDTLSCILSFFIIFLFTVGTKINKKNIKKYIIIFLCLIIGFVLSVNILDSIFNYNIEKRVNKNIEEIIIIFKDGISDSTGNGRVFVWKKALKIANENLINGIGIDNFGIAQNGSYVIFNDGNKIHYFDKVHNEYLQKLVTEGIFSFVTYMFLLFYIIYKYLKCEKKLRNYSLFFVYIGYLIQAIFNISVISVAPIFYIIMGFLISDCNEVGDL